MVSKSWKRLSVHVVSAFKSGRTEKPIPSSYDFAALSGKFKLQVMRKLPAKFDTICRMAQGLGAQVAQLWNVSAIYVYLHMYLIIFISVVSSTAPSSTDVSSFHDKVPLV